ncbi:MAG TPA: hypothetical protein VF144_00895 [Chitinophagaceae bacterium]
MITTLSRLVRQGFLLMVLPMLAIGCANNTAQTSPALGKYKMYSDDPEINRFISFEDNYIQINKDNTIIYNSTINSKPRFNFKGDYEYDAALRTLTIKWSDGKIPEKLIIEKNGDDDIIKIGQTSYKRLKTK